MLFKLKEILVNPEYEKYVQFVKFGMVGGLNTLISYLVYLLFVEVFRQHYLAGNLLGFLISVLNSFYWNRRFVFKKGKEPAKLMLISLIKTFVSYSATGVLLNSFLLFLLVDYFKIISAALAPLLILLVTIPLNFIFNKYWAMKK